MLIDHGRNRMLGALLVIGLRLGGTFLLIV